MDETTKKSVLRMFTYGLFAVTATHQGELSAMTADWLSQASFEPPMIMLAVEADSQSRRVIEAQGAFALNILASGQRELAGQLGRASARKPDKLAGIAWRPGPTTGAPLLDDALGWLECRATGSLPAGDHLVFVAEVVGVGLNREGQPLTMAEAGFRYSG